MRLKVLTSQSNILPIIWFFLVILDIWLSLSPNATPPIEFKESDKVYHMLMYLVLGTLPFLFPYRLKKIILLVIFCLFLGILLECIQFYVPNRFFSLWDIVANETGITIALLIGSRLHKAEDL